MVEPIFVAVAIQMQLQHLLPADEPLSSVAMQVRAKIAGELFHSPSLLSLTFHLSYLSLLPLPSSFLSLFSFPPKTLSSPPSLSSLSPCPRASHRNPAPGHLAEKHGGMMLAPENEAILEAVSESFAVGVLHLTPSLGIVEEQVMMRKTFEELQGLGFGVWGC
jgi:hypothetical protein